MTEEEIKRIFEQTYLILLEKEAKKGGITNDTHLVLKTRRFTSRYIQEFNGLRKDLSKEQPSPWDPRKPKHKTDAELIEFCRSVGIAVLSKDPFNVRPW